jgi:hypothetical protein
MRQAATTSLVSRVADNAYWSRDVSISTMILIALLVLLVAALPIWKHSKVWGYTPSVWLVLMLAAHMYTVATAH